MLGLLRALYVSQAGVFDLPVPLAFRPLVNHDAAQLPAIALQSDQSLWGSAPPVPYHHCIDVNHRRRDT